jgi:hypothetical protein
VVIGIVRDARDGAPAAGVTVLGDWLELSFGPAGIVRRVPTVIFTTGENGWFALCNVPSPGTMTLLASRGAESTDRIEVQVPAEGFLRRELYLGPARTVIAGDTAQRGGTPASRSRRLHAGDGRLRGTVVAAVGGKPLSGARVGIPDGPQTRANDRGEWTLVDAPAGTRMLEVRAIGYYPERRPVDVVADAAPIRAALSTLEAVLDTVRVVATRLGGFAGSGFAERRRSSGTGHFLTPDDVARRRPIVTSDLFRTVPGVYVERGDFGDPGISMRGIFTERCSPALYLDGQHMQLLGADLIDDLVHPDELAGIEIYTAGMAPPQFQPALSGGCGSIVIWSKPRTALPKRKTRKDHVSRTDGASERGSARAAPLGGPVAAPLDRAPRAPLDRPRAQHAP